MKEIKKIEKLRNNLHSSKKLHGKMKIGQITLLGRNFNHNFGATLQAYALHRVLASEGYQVELIDYVPTSPTFSHHLRRFYRLINIEDPIYVLRRFPTWLLKKLGKRKSKPTPEFHERIKKFEEFKRRYIKFTSNTFHEINELKILNSKYDAYVVGSDVVWSPRYNDENRLKTYLLTFVDNGLKISYAASVGDRNIPKWACKIFRKYLKDFDAVSVRERASAEVIKKCTQIEPKVVLDPTALLDKDEWVKIAKPPEKYPEKPYILVYDLKRSAEILSQIKRIAEKMGLEIVTYSHSENNISFYSYGPQEFIWLYKNADFVVTSSFHGTVFAVLFNKPFYAIDPEPYAPSARITDFLNHLNLEERFVKDPTNLAVLSFEIEWERSNKKLKSKRNQSLKFLRESLRGV